MDILPLIFIAVAWFSIALPMVLHFRTSKQRHEELLAKLAEFGAHAPQADDEGEWVVIEPQEFDQSVADTCKG